MFRHANLTLCDTHELHPCAIEGLIALPILASSDRTTMAVTIHLDAQGSLGPVLVELELTIAEGSLAPLEDGDPTPRDPDLDIDQWHLHAVDLQQPEEPVLEEAPRTSTPRLMKIDRGTKCDPGASPHSSLHSGADLVQVQAALICEPVHDESKLVRRELVTEVQEQPRQRRARHSVHDGDVGGRERAGLVYEYSRRRPMATRRDDVDDLLDWMPPHIKVFGQGGV
ncbi:MAG: hypothetical protein JWM90_1289 [Thermoleophilia bacterium]|nr:hypothetical protein [Thermoleophilia bacterium]